MAQYSSMGAAQGGQMGRSAGMNLASGDYAPGMDAGGTIGMAGSQMQPQSKADTVDAGIDDDAHFMDPNWDPSQLDHDPYTLMSNGLTPEDVHSSIQNKPQTPGQMPPGVPGQSSLQSLVGGLPADQQDAVVRQSMPADTLGMPTPQSGPIEDDERDQKRRRNLLAGISALLSVGAGAASFGTLHNTRGPELQVLQNIMASRAGQMQLGRR